MPATSCGASSDGRSRARDGPRLPGTFEEPKAPVFVDGRLMLTLKGDHIVAEFIKIVDNYVESHYTAREQKLVGISN